MNHETLKTECGQCGSGACGCRCYKSISCKAIFAGTLVALGLSFLLNLFGVAIGLTAYATSAEGVTTLAIGGYIGMAIGVMVAMFVAGWVSGFLGHKPYEHCNLGIIYGFSTWSLAIILSVILASSVGQFLTRQYEFLTNPNSIAVRISSPTEAISTHTTAASLPTASKTSITNNNTTKQVDMKDENAIKALGKSLLLIFLLFLIGAILCSYGGYVGVNSAMRHRVNE